MKFVMRRKGLLVIIGLCICVVLIVAFFFGLYSARDLKKIVSEQFNGQQLILARQAAHEIENSLNYAMQELVSIRYIVQHGMPISKALLEGVYKRVRGKGIDSVGIVDINGKTLIRAGRDLIKDLSSLFQKKGLTGPFLHFLTKKKQILVLACPLTEDKVAVFLVDVYKLVKGHVDKIRSGKTGYAWVIDQNGHFIFHPIKKFLGKNAFKARHEEAPYFPFKKIDILQKKMLNGEEGTGEYASLWHGETKKYFNKLIAYTPVHLPYTSTIWSVAVCAPEQEVNAVIHRAYLRHFFLQGAVIFALLLVGLFLLISERRFSDLLKEEVARKTEILKKSEKRRRLLIEGADDLIFTLDLNGRLISANKATLSFFSKDKEILGMDFGMLFHWSEQQSKGVLEQLSRGQTVNMEHTIEVNSQKYWLNTKFMPLNLGDIKEILCIARDITEIKQAEEQLVNAEKLASIGTLAAGVAHEINNPLGIIIGFCNLLMENTPKESQSYKDLKTIEKHALHCKNIVENLLNFARTKGDGYKIADVNKSLEGLLNIVKHTLEVNNIEIHTDFAKNLPLVRGDEQELQQVFLNLITNAMDAMDSRGRLFINTKFNPDTRCVEISFQDTGCGIREELIERIFDPFFTTKEKGTGLGLSISYGIVKKYGGTIICKNQKKGATFIISLPIAEK